MQLEQRQREGRMEKEKERDWDGFCVVLFP
jgi:hypothetical protein